MLDLSPFQPVTRDFAFVVDRAVKAGDLVRAAQNVDRKLIADVTVFDVYEGQGIEPGKKSIAIAVTIQPREKTMTDEEIEALGAKIVAEVGKRTGGTAAGVMARAGVSQRQRLRTSPPAALSLHTSGPSRPARRGHARASALSPMMSGTRVRATQTAPAGPHAGFKAERRTTI